MPKQDSLPAPTSATLTTAIEPPTIDATVRLDPKRGLMWVLGYPAYIEPDEFFDADCEGWHNCDQMGCGSAGAHVLAVVRLWPDQTEHPGAQRLDGEAGPS